jgi:uncharacterized membrane protein
MSIGTLAPNQASKRRKRKSKQLKQLHTKEVLMNKQSIFAATAAAIALSSVAAFAAEPPAGSSGRAIDSNDTVHCYGVHDCSGNADCATTENACKGMNACKGHGFQALEAGACLTRGGTIGDLSGE